MSRPIMGDFSWLAQPLMLVQLLGPTQNLAGTHNRYDVPYGPLPAQTADICLPDGAEGFRPNQYPGVLLIHGGGWSAGDKKALQGVCVALAKSGFVAVNINYRLVRHGDPATYWPAQLADAQLAMRWMRAKAPYIHLQGQRICAYGESAGAHLAVFLGVEAAIQPSDMAHQLSAVSPAAHCVVDAFGPVDFPSAPMQWTAANNLLGRARGTPPDASWQKISPLPDVGPRSAPTLIVQGADDETVPPDQSRRLQEKLRRAGVVAAYIEYGGGHNWRGTTSAARVKIRDQIINFLRSKLLP